MSERRRLTPREVGIVKFLGRHQAAGLRFVSLGRQLRVVTVPLWRAGLVEIWYRQMPDTRPSLRGPRYSLSFSGRRLAAALFPQSGNPSPGGLHDNPQL